MALPSQLQNPIDPAVLRRYFRQLLTHPETRTPTVPVVQGTTVGGCRTGNRLGAHLRSVIENRVPPGTALALLRPLIRFFGQ